jgi:hypothetical protein
MQASLGNTALQAVNRLRFINPRGVTFLHHPALCEAE